MRVNNSTYSIVAQYQVEYQGVAEISKEGRKASLISGHFYPRVTLNQREGVQESKARFYPSGANFGNLCVVQYYRLAYNLHQLGRLKWVMQTSLVRTLAKKLKTSMAQVYKRFKTTHQNEHGTYKVLEVVVERGPDTASLVARFGGIPLRRNKWAAINDAETVPIWSGRSEVVERLLAQECELCGATDNIGVHHIRKLADLNQDGRGEKPLWVQRMARRRRKSLVVCQDCHHDIHYGRYDGPALSK